MLGASDGPSVGWYAVSVMFLRGYRGILFDGLGNHQLLNEPYYIYFQHFQPVALAGYSIYIYHLDLVDCDRVRAKLGLPPLAKALPTTPASNDKPTNLLPVGRSPSATTCCFGKVAGTTDSVHEGGFSNGWMDNPIAIELRSMFGAGLTSARGWGT